MKENMHKSPDYDQIKDSIDKSELKKEPKFSDLDVKGREIFGLEPKMEKFSTLEVGKDVEILKKNKEIKSDNNLDSNFIFINPTSGTESRLVQAPHWRTISNDTVHSSLDTDNGTEYFYTANTKGVGYLKPTLKEKNYFDDYKEWNRIDEYDFEGAYGLADKEDFFTSDGDVVLKSKWLTEQGLRTELYYAISKLKNVYYQGKLTPISELREKDIIPNQKIFIPEMGIRLLKTNARIAEVKDADEVRTKELFTQAFKVFNKESKDKNLELPEITVGDSKSEEVYFQEFFKRMGKNIAVLQNIGYIGWHLHSANITLAAEIADIGPYESWKEVKNDPEFVKEYNGVRRGVLKDIRDIAYDLKYLIGAGEKIGMTIPDTKELMNMYLNECNLNLKKQILQNEEKVNPEKLKEMIKKITTMILVENKNLPALKHGNDIDDWGI